MTENQTRPTNASVAAFVERVEHPVRRRDAHELLSLFTRVTGVEPQMWGPAIIGFGSMHYKYDSGREGDMPRVGFSPRKANLSLYVLTKHTRATMLERLGKHRTSVSCLYINKLDDVDLGVLEEMIRSAWAQTASP